MRQEFLRLVGRRYKRGLLILTSNRQADARPEVLAGGGALTTTIQHHFLVAQVNGSRYRLTELDAVLRSPVAVEPRPEQAT